MKEIGELMVLFFVFVFLSWVQRTGSKRQRIDDAYRWKKPQIHGQRKFASRIDLWKAGLL